ncbi:helix-turn-helix domain-containing protein [Streptosporangium lutulentum]
MGIGNDLAEARRAMGLTVGQLSERTRVREALIHAMEREDFSLCGGDFYTRGHLRNIAKVLGLDYEALIHRYDDQHGACRRRCGRPPCSRPTHRSRSASAARPTGRWPWRSH